MAETASRKATLVWVYPPGLKTIPCAEKPCSCKAFTNSPSTLLWLIINLKPLSKAIVCRASLSSASVMLPYTSGSRTPSKFRFGPWRIRIFFTARIYSISSHTGRTNADHNTTRIAAMRFSTNPTRAIWPIRI